MASTERPAFLHWKKTVPHSKTKPRKASQRVRLKVEETRGKLILKPEEKVGVLQLPPSTVDRPVNGLSVATLRDLCPQDKARVRGLVEQLAAVGEEKEQLAVAIKEDRAQFMQLLDKLKSEHNKVLSENDEITRELHSSQLQLQQLHTAVTPHTHPRPSTSHASHMTTTSNQRTPPYNKTSKTFSQSLPNRIMTTAVNSVPPLLLSTKEGSTNERSNRELTPHSDDWQTLPSTSPQSTPFCTHHMTPNTGHMTPNTSHMTPEAGHVTSKSGHVTPNAMTPEAEAGHMTSKSRHMTPEAGYVTPNASHMTPGAGHMTSKSGHVTPNAIHMTPGAGHVTPKIDSGWTTPPAVIVSSSPVIPAVPTPPTLVGTPPLITQTVQSSATQTNLLDISELTPLVTMDTSHPLPGGQSSLPILPSRPKEVFSLTRKASSSTGKKFSPQRTTPSIRKRQSNKGDAAPTTSTTDSLLHYRHTIPPPTHTHLTDCAISDDDTLTRSMLEQHTAKQSTRTQSTSTNIPSLSSRSHNESLLSSEMDSLLATALLNARDTLNTIQAFSKSIGSAQSTSLNSTSHTSDSSINKGSQTNLLKVSSKDSRYLPKRVVGLKCSSAHTSTPYVGCGGDGLLSHRLESPLETAIEWDDDELSEILEHAHSLSRLSRISYHDNESSQSEHSDNDDEIIDELFFI